MTVETLTSRIENAKAKLAKLEAKIKRIEKAKASNYEANNPYFYSERDYRIASREIAETKETIEKHEALLNAELSKKRDIEPIVNFLNMWRANVKAYYTVIRVEPEREELKAKWYEASQKACEFFNHTRWTLIREGKMTKEEAKAEDARLHTESRVLKDRYNDRYSYVEYLERNGFEETLEKELDEEWKRKYDKLIADVEKITGQITDASFLRENEKGDLDGIVEGVNGRARVNTFGAGGWNIQCFHYRTKVTRVK